VKKRESDVRDEVYPLASPPCIAHSVPLGLTRRIAQIPDLASAVPKSLYGIPLIRDGNRCLYSTEFAAGIPDLTSPRARVDAHVDHLVVRR
jgi:hypothetical protein